MDTRVYRQKLALMAWIRVGLGALAGLVAGLMGFLSFDPAQLNSNNYYGFYIAAIVYIFSYYIAKYSVLKGIDPKNKNKLFTQGIGSYIMVFLFVWIFYNTSCVIFGCVHF